MTLRVVFRRIARRELEEASLWYERRRAGLSARFRLEVERSLLQAADGPRRYPVVYRAVRCVRVRRFPFSILFLAERERIVVLSVFHARRNPLAWRERV